MLEDDDEPEQRYAKQLVRQTTKRMELEATGEGKLQVTKEILAKLGSGFNTEVQTQAKVSFHKIASKNAGLDANERMEY